MITLVILASVYVVVSAGTVQYDKKIECSIRGPKFWCESKETARQCDATSFCNERVWSKASVEDDTCTMCQQYVGTIHMLLANNATEAEVLNAMKTMCAMLPATVQSECTAVVDQYGQMALDMIIQYTADPKNLCTMIGMCTAGGKQVENVNFDRFTSLIKEKVKVNADYCMTCQQYVGTIHMVISNNATQAEILNYLESACTLLPSTLAPECSAAMTIFGPQLVNWLVQYTADPIQFCTLIGLCKKVETSRFFVKPEVPKDVVKVSMGLISQASKPKKVAAPRSAVTCELCTVALGYLDGILQENTTREAVKNGLDQLCEKLPSSLLEECTILVSEYSANIIILLADELKDTTEVCTLIHLCSSSFKRVTKKISYSNGIQCKACEYAANYLDSILEDNRTESAVRAALDAVCGYIPESYKTECTTLVDQYTDQIVKLLVQELAQPEELCKLLGLCSASKAVSATKPVKKVSSGITCEVCQLAMGYLDQMLDGNNTKAEVRTVLDEVCGYLPAKMLDECKDLVNTFSDTIVDFIVTELKNPTEICKEIGLCTASNVKAIKKVSNVITCDVCTYAMGYLDEMLKGDKTKAAIESALDKLCGYLPTSMSSECSSLVNTYGPKIIELLAQELSPALVCKELGLCTSAIILKKPHSAVTCEFCKLAMQYLDGMLQGNQTERAVTEALDKVCGLLPGQYKTECVSLVNEYAPEIVRLLVEELANPSTICTQLGLCTAFKKSTYHKQPHLIGGIVTCDICMYAMGKLDSILTDNSTEEEIIHAVESLCSELPSSMAGQCQLLVETDGDAIIQLLVNEVEPSEVCQTLGLCASKVVPKGSRKYMLAMRLSLKGVSCQICKYAMGYLGGLLEEATTKKEIEQVVENLCSHFSSAIKNECDALITEYGDELINLIVQQIQPEAICEKLQLCKEEKRLP